MINRPKTMAGIFFKSVKQVQLQAGFRVYVATGFGIAWRYKNRSRLGQPLPQFLLARQQPPHILALRRA